MKDVGRIVGTAVEPIDAAHENFRRIVPEISRYLDSVQTEADVRLKVIDRILVEVLHWPYESIQTEPHTDAGYADYALLDSGLCRVILEAKRDGLSLGIEQRRPGGAFKLSGGVFQSAAAKEGIGQAIRYCGERSAELACITNGREWILFRGSRMGDGKPVREGHAFVFPSLAAVEEQFALFYGIISREEAIRFGYRPYFHEAEGQPIRTSIFQKSLRAPGSARLQAGSALANDIDRIMGEYFQRLTGDQDPGMLEDCFVETNESLYADRQIARIANDMLDRIQALDTGQGVALAELVARVKATGRHEFVLIVGTKGAGKTTFITRFFRNVLDEKVRNSSVVLRLDLREHSGEQDDVVRWLNTQLITSAESQLFSEGTPTFAEIQGMFFDEYRRLSKGTWAAVYDADPSHSQFHVKFGDMVEEMRLSRKGDFLRGLLRHITTNRRQLPILVFDNTDHFDIQFQQQVYQFARSLYELEVCLVILPVTDRTSWQLSKHGALQSFEHESFFLPAPRTDEIIRKRIEFIDRRVALAKERPDDRYAIAGNWHLQVDDLAAFTQTLQRVFLQTSNVSDWIGSLANHDVRRTLALARQFIGSPHLRVNDLAKAYLAGSALDVPPSRVAKALIRQKYDIYPVGSNDFVQNLFAINHDVPTSPLLGIRILQLLSDVIPDERRNSLLAVDDIEAYFGAMAVENRAVRLWLDGMLKTGLVLDYDPTISDIETSRQVEISPSGRQHMFWALGNYEYINAMMEVTPLLAEVVFMELLNEARANVDWHRRTGRFIRYLLDEDAFYCLVPSHEAYKSQQRLRATLEPLCERLSGWTNSPKAGERTR